MQTIITLLFVVAAIIHFLPFIGVLGAGQLTKLYGLPFDEPNLVILMRNRAVLFGLIGAFMAYAAFYPLLQSLALISGLVSFGSFVLLAWSRGAINQRLKRVVVMDIVGLICLGIILILKLLF